MSTVSSEGARYWEAVRTTGVKPSSTSCFDTPVARVRGACDYAQQRVGWPPSTGRYSFGDMGPRTFIGIYTHETEGGSSGTYLPSEGGVVEIESATERAIRGRLEFRAEGSNTYNLWAVQGHVRLSATFTAEPTEGDPYEFARLPGELRALAKADGEETLLDGSDAGVPTSLDAFAAGIVEHLVVGLSLPLVFEVFADYGVGETQVRRVEALLFAALPFDALLKVGHFGERSGEVQTAFRRAVAAWATATAGVSGDTMAELVEGRLDEYAGILFKEGEFAVREDGMLTWPSGRIPTSSEESRTTTDSLRRCSPSSAR